MSSTEQTGRPGSNPNALTQPSPGRVGALVRDCVTIGVTVGLAGVAFGVASDTAGLTVAQTCVLSLLVFTGASQFAFVGAIAGGAAPLAVVPGTLMLGIRNAFYGLRLAERLELPRWIRPLAAQWVIDETVAITLAQPDRRRARIAFAVTGGTIFACWNLCTLAGALGATALGDPARFGLDAAGPAVFLALLTPWLRGDGRSSRGTERAVALLGAVIALAVTPFLPLGVPVLLAVVAVPVVLGAQWLRTARGSTARRSTAQDQPADRGGSAGSGALSDVDKSSEVPGD